MSARTAYNFARYLSLDTRQAINAILDVDWADYAANIEGKLRIRGEHGLANRMLEEIRRGQEGDKERFEENRERRRQDAIAERRQQIADSRRFSSW